MDSLLPGQTPSIGNEGALVFASSGDRRGRSCPLGRVYVRERRVPSRRAPVSVYVADLGFEGNGRQSQ